MGHGMRIRRGKRAHVHGAFAEPNDGNLLITKYFQGLNIALRDHLALKGTSARKFGAIFLFCVLADRKDRVIEFELFLLTVMRNAQRPAIAGIAH